MKRILALILTISSFCLCSCSDKTLTRSNLYFDTVCTITIYSGGSQEVLDKAFEKLESYDSLFDRYEKGPLASLSSDPVKVDPELLELVAKNLEYNSLTGGIFSPALGTLIDTWAIGAPETKEPPDFEKIAAALEHTDPGGIVVDRENGTISLKDPQIKIDLGATVKGYVSEKLKEFLEKNGVKSAIIDLGGNITLIGDKSGEPFSIGIDDPVEPSKILATLELEDTSIVTSGTYQRYFTDEAGNRYHHILDPTTGYPANTGLKEVVVIGEDALDDDFLSTTLLLMGYDRAKNFIENSDTFKENQYIFVTDDKIYVSRSLEGFSLEPDQTYELEYF